MRIDEVRRRNRRRAVALATVAVLNQWLIVSLFVVWIGWGLSAKVGADVPWPLIVSCGVTVAAIWIAFHVQGRFAAVGPAVVTRFLAQKVDAASHPRIHNLLSELALAVGVAPVRAAVMEDPAPNALTVGTRADEMTIVLTTGLIEQLNRDELAAVIAAQMCAIRRLDVLLDTVVTACADGAIAMHTGLREDWKDPRSWLSIAATFPTMLVARGIRSYADRHVDFGADAMAVGITRHPAALISALTKLRDDPQVVVSNNADLRSLWFEPLPHPEGRDDAARRAAGLRSIDARIARLRAAPGVVD